MTTLVTLLVNLSALTDFDLQPVRKRIYNGCAYAMETAGNLVSAAAEFTAGMQDRENNLYCRNARFVVDSNRMPRPLSTTVIELSSLIVTSMWSQKPASASSTALSTIS